MRLGLISVSLFYRVGSSGSFVRQAFFGGEMSNADFFCQATICNCTVTARKIGFTQFNRCKYGAKKCNLGGN